jgi:hypothetical protein
MAGGFFYMRQIVYFALKHFVYTIVLANLCEALFCPNAMRPFLINLV